MRPHVLYVTPILGYPAFGGPRLRTYNTLRALARCADVSLFLTDQPDTPDRAAARAHLLTFCRDVVFPDPESSPSRVRGALRTLVPSPVRSVVRRLRPPVHVESDALVERDPAVIDRLRDWILTAGPDLVWLGFGGISYDLVPLKAQTGKPLVLETECVWSRFVLRELPFEADEQRRQRILREGQAKEAEERAGAALVDMTTAASEVDADYFRSLVADPGRVMLLANVIDVDAYQAPSTDVRLQQPALVFAGSLSRGTANVDATCWLVDEVLPMVWRRRPDVHVYIVGRSPAPEILARRGPRVHVTGEVPSIVPYLRASVAALVPLRWESGHALQDSGSLRVQDAGRLHDPGRRGPRGRARTPPAAGRRSGDFSSAILSLVEAPALGQRLVEPAYNLVRAEYDLSSAERQINAILARLGVVREAVRP